MKNFFSGKALVVVVLALTVSIIFQINAVSSQTNKTLAWQVAGSPTSTGTKTASPSPTGTNTSSPSPTGTKTSSPSPTGTKTSIQTPTPRIAPIIFFYMPLIYK